MPKPVITFVFKVLGNGLPRYILDTCPNLWSRSCSSQCFGMVCLGKYLTHAQTCHHVRVQSATESTASVHAWHMWSRLLRNYGLPRHIILNTCPNLWSPSCSKCYGIDCLGTYLTHAQTCDPVRVLHSALEWFAWVNTWHMPKPVITFVFKVLRNRLPRYMLDTCDHACYGIMDCLGT